MEASLYEEVEKFKKEIPSAKEVQKAKNQIESSFIMGQDSIFLQAMKYGKFEMIGDWRYLDKYLEGIRNVQPDDITDVVKKYFTEDNRTVGILVPVKMTRSEE